MIKKIEKKSMHASDFMNEPIEYNRAFSRGMKVSINGATILFISGTASVDEKGKTYCSGNFLKQVGRTFINLTALLKSENADWHDVVMTRCYLKNMKYYGEFNDFRNQFYKKEKLNPFPASVCVEANLCRLELLIEIEATVIFESRKIAIMTKRKKKKRF